MTVGELTRLLASKRRVTQREQQKQASFNYILAELIGKSVARIYSSSAHMPKIEEVYPELFNTPEMAEARAKQTADMSAARFRAFANAFNSKHKEVAK